MSGLSGRNCRDLSLPCLQIHTAEALGCLASSPQGKDPFSLFIKKQNKMIPADFSRRVEFVDKLLFMESLVTGWGMCGKMVGKTVFLFHDFSMHYPRGYQRWNSCLSIKSTLFLRCCKTGRAVAVLKGLVLFRRGVPRRADGV